MTDPVLQSFCERCGTRYTATDPQSKPAETGGKGMLARFGRRGTESSVPEVDPTPLTASPASEVFADIFSFCMDCRQYTCKKCWNEEAHACLTCRPPGSVYETGSSVLMGGVVSSGSSGSSASRPASDEWGRPLAPASDPGVDSEQGNASIFGGGAGAVDPWRGVVFSRDSSTAPSVEKEDQPAPTIDFAAQRGAPPAAEGWPQADQRPTTQPTPVEAWPDVDRRPAPAPEPPLEPTPAPAPEPPSMVADVAQAPETEPPAGPTAGELESDDPVLAPTLPEVQRSEPATPEPEADAPVPVRVDLGGAGAAAIPESQEPGGTEGQEHDVETEQATAGTFTPPQEPRVAEEQGPDVAREQATAEPLASTPDAPAPADLGEAEVSELPAESATGAIARVGTNDDAVRADEDDERAAPAVIPSPTVSVPGPSASTGAGPEPPQADSDDETPGQVPEEYSAAAALGLTAIEDLPAEDEGTDEAFDSGFDVARITPEPPPTVVPPIEPAPPLHRRCRHRPQPCPLPRQRRRPLRNPRRCQHRRRYHQARDRPSTRQHQHPSHRFRLPRHHLKWSRHRDPSTNRMQRQPRRRPRWSGCLAPQQAHHRAPRLRHRAINPYHRRPQSSRPRLLRPKLAICRPRRPGPHSSRRRRVPSSARIAGWPSPPRRASAAAVVRPSAEAHGPSPADPGVCPAR